MKRKELSAAAVLFLLLCCFATCSTNREKIIGLWQSSVKLKSNLLMDPKDESSLAGYMYINQQVTYDFREDGCFMQKVVHTLDSLKKEKLFPANINEARLARKINTSLIFYGKYSLRGNILRTVKETVEYNDKTSEPYFVYYGRNPNREPPCLEEEITFNGDALFVADLECLRLDSTSGK